MSDSSKPKKALPRIAQSSPSAATNSKILSEPFALFASLRLIQTQFHREVAKGAKNREGLIGGGRGAAVWNSWPSFSVHLR